MPANQFSAYRAAIARLFTEVDPWQLAAAGAPDDEYEPEISALLKWPTPVTGDELRRVLGDIDEAVGERLEKGIAEHRCAFGYRA